MNPGARPSPQGGLCPCQHGEPYETCCAPLLRGERAAPTAARLMRSRFTAFAVGDVGYLEATWHPRTRPKTLTLDPGQRWVRLEVLATSGGGLLQTTGTVEFRAHYTFGRQRGEMHEVSRFVREGGRWLYLDGDVS